MDMIKYKKGNFLWKLSKGYIKKPISDIFIRNTYNPLRFNLPNPNCESDRNKIVFSCVKYWNSIPSHIRNASTLDSFNDKHKKFLMQHLS